MSIAEKLQIIAENEQKVYEAGKFSLLNDSKYMHPIVSGSVIAASDVFSVKHEFMCNLESKNLFDASMYLTNSTTWEYATLKLTPNTDYVFTTNLPSEFRETMRFFAMNSMDAAQSSTQVMDSRNCIVRTLDDGIMKIQWQNQTDGDFFDYWYQLELGSTATEYTPYISDFSEVSVSRHGKNLFDINQQWYKDPSIRDIAVENNEFTLTRAGTKTTALTYVHIYLTVGTYKLTGSVTQSDGLNGGWSLMKDGSYLINGSSLGTINGTINITEDGEYTFGFYVNYNSADGTIATYSNVQLELGSTATEYEPYIEPQTVTANADGTVNGLMSISPNMTILTDKSGVNINCQYYRDIDTYIDNLMIDVATSGGE